MFIEVEFVTICRQLALVPAGMLAHVALCQFIEGAGMTFISLLAAMIDRINAVRYLAPKVISFLSGSR